MKNKVWKTFAAHEVSHSVAHYLTTIHGLHDSHGYARVSDVARELELTKGAVSVQLKHLKEKGFVSEDENRFLQLTALGEDVAREVRETRKILIEFLTRVLCVSGHQAEEDACKIEHLLSHETTEHMRALVEMFRAGSVEGDAFIEKFRKFQEARASVSKAATSETEADEIRESESKTEGDGS